ncbi:hypothetical protein [Curtobacterium pusillum]|uniref:hypothetical protein n=1 Tax=Curtobacterium pusillum TaxID=69373 RepID=UPI0011A5A088|nr:hypothetical protein [Curtobacterium pusillum]
MRSLLHAPRTRKRSIAAATLGALAIIGSLLVATPAQALNDTGTGGVFVPSTGRILDTKAGTGGFSTPMEAGKYRTIKVAGLAGLPDDGSVGAVSLNATVGGSAGYGTLFGRPDADTGRTTMLIYNGVSGEYTSNSATLAVGADGTIQVMTETASRLILDVQGYYTANTDGTAAGGFVPVAKRLVDTRSGTGAAKAAIAPGKSIDVQITGANGVPAGASAAVVNLIAVNSTDADGYLTPYATGGTKPANSLHYAPAETTSVQAQVPLSAAGKMTIANSSTTTNLLVDLQGYFTAAGQGGAVFTPSYGRAYDSRASGNTALAKNETRSIQVAGTAGVPVMGSGITAVTLTLIVAHGGSAGYADVYADGKTNPGITAVNFQPDEIQTNTITVPLGANGKIALRNAAEATNYVVDVQGWYTNPQAPSISCPAPYAAGAWVAAKPSSLTCTVKVAPADSSSNVVSVLADADYTEFTRSDSAAVTKSVAVSPDAGLHTITAVSTAPDGSDITTSYEFGLGDWSAAPIRPLLADSSTASTTPLLSVASDGDLIPADASIRYTVISADGSVAADSGAVVGAWHIPADTLTAAQSYTWTATVTAPAAGATTTSTVTSPSWAFSTSSDVTDDYAGAPTMTETSTESGSDTINPDDVQSPTITTGGSSTTASGGSTSTPSSVQVKAAKSKSKLLQASATKKVTGGRGSFRVSFSSVATINSKVTYANVDGESANYFTGKKPNKVTLTDYVNGSGIDLSASIGDGGPSVTITNSGKTIKWGSSTTKNKYVEHDWDRFSYSATYIQSITESATGTVTFGSSSWSTRAG